MPPHLFQRQSLKHLSAEEKLQHKHQIQRMRRAAKRQRDMPQVDDYISRIRQSGDDEAVKALNEGTLPLTPVTVQGLARIHEQSKRQKVEQLATAIKVKVQEHDQPEEPPSGLAVIVKALDRIKDLQKLERKTEIEYIGLTISRPGQAKQYLLECQEIGDTLQGSIRQRQALVAQVKAQIFEEVDDVIKQQNDRDDRPEDLEGREGGVVPMLPS